MSTTPGLVEAMAADWRKGARFYTRFGITEAQFRHGVRDAPVDESDYLEQQMRPESPTC